MNSPITSSGDANAYPSLVQHPAGNPSLLPSTPERLHNPEQAAPPQPRPRSCQREDGGGRRERALASAADRAPETGQASVPQEAGSPALAASRLQCPDLEAHAEARSA